MSGEDPPLRDLRTDDIEEMASVLARAFQDDPFYRFLCPDPERRRAVLPWLFASWMRYVQRTGRAWVTAGGEGAVLWRTPGKYSLTVWDEVRRRRHEEA
jgi:hypothetical protein